MILVYPYTTSTSLGCRGNLAYYKSRPADEDPGGEGEAVGGWEGPLPSPSDAGGGSYHRALVVRGLREGGRRVRCTVSHGYSMYKGLPKFPGSFFSFFFWRWVKTRFRVG